MTNKKISDLRKVSTLEDGDLLIAEKPSVESVAIPTIDIIKQIQTKLLELSYTDFGCIKCSLIAPENNTQPNLVYCDGTTYYANSSNPLIASFINEAYKNAQLRDFLQIPADKSSFKTPDLRNQHLVGVGSGNTAYQYITSKVISVLCYSYHVKI